jgi:hypothetical protein
MNFTLAGLRIVKMQLLVPWRGAWIANVDLDPEQLAQVPPSGPVVITQSDDLKGPIGTFLGTIDPRASGVFLASAHLQVVAGAGGWDNPVTRQAWHNDGGVLSTEVYQATANAVGEQLIDQAPVRFLADFLRSVGPASRVLANVDWWVDFAGVTRVGARPTPTADSSLEVLDWEPFEQRLELSCDVPIVPGTVVSDPRIGPAPVTIRDVDQMFDGQKMRAQAWCATAPSTRLMTALHNLVEELGGTKYLKVYRYRFVQDRGRGLALQAVDKVAGLPDAIPVLVWGPAGIKAKLKGAQEVLVDFVNGDPTQPVVRGISDVDLPLENTVDASVAVHLGPSAPAVDIAGGAAPLVPSGWATALAAGLAAFTSAIGTTPTLPGIVAAASALGTALGSLPPSATTKTKAT